MTTARPSTDQAASPPPRRPNPRVSDIIASYNGERYVAATLRSLQAQTLRDIEIVVVDDGSRAPTLAILDQFAREDPRFRIHRASHGGLVSTLNTAISLAHAPYIARIDHDDIAKPERLAKQAAYLDAHPDCLAVGCDIDMIDGDSLDVFVGQNALDE